jgi:hypothetical protein
MRLDPQLKYLAELAARRQRRSLANFFEWAIEDTLRRVALRDASDSGQELSAANAGPMLWDQREPDRVLKLARECPDLLNYEEQRYLSVVNDFELRGKSGKLESVFKSDERVDLDLVRGCWEEIKNYALGKIGEDKLAKKIDEQLKRRKKKLLLPPRA